MASQYYTFLSVSLTTIVKIIPFFRFLYSMVSVTYLTEYVSYKNPILKELNTQKRNFWICSKHENVNYK